MIKLIVCDIEGCLTINKKQPIDTGALTKIHTYCELARRGKKPPLVLCTGRPQPYAEAIIQCLDAFFPRFPSVVENGCFLYDPVEDSLLPNPAIEKKEDDLQKVKLFLQKKVVKTGLAKIEPGKEICVSLNPLNGETSKDLRGKVVLLLPKKLKDIVFITNSSSAVDITPLGVNKASGLNFLSQKTGIDVSEMIGIGDTVGDFPMLKIVGFPACPSNASPEVINLVKERNGFVSQKPNTLGVWEILLHYNLIE